MRLLKMVKHTVATLYGSQLKHTKGVSMKSTFFRRLFLVILDLSLLVSVFTLLPQGAAHAATHVS